MLYTRLASKPDILGGCRGRERVGIVERFARRDLRIMSFRAGLYALQMFTNITIESINRFKETSRVSNLPALIDNPIYSLRGDGKLA